MGKPRGPPKRNGGRGGEKSEPEIHAAARSGDVQKVEFISNSDPLVVNLRDKHSRTPLHLAAWSGQNDVVSCLIKHKADISAAAMDDTGAIHFASQKGHLEVVRTLLSAGVSVKATTRKGFTPLHYAVQGSHLDLVKYLVRKGANLSAKTKSGQTPGDLANSEIQTFLLECEQSSRKEDKEGKSIISTSEKVDDLEAKQDSDANESSAKAEEEGSDGRGKRKVEEESLLGTKKARVSLHHLEDEDDAEDGEEE